MKTLKSSFNIGNTIDVTFWNKMTFKFGVTGMLLSVMRPCELPSRGLKSEILKRTIVVYDTKESDLCIGKALRQELDSYNTVYKYIENQGDIVIEFWEDDTVELLTKIKPKFHK